MSRIGIGYEIGRFTGVCAATGAPLPPGSACVATLTEAPDDATQADVPHVPSGADGFVRQDFSVAAWEAGNRPDRLFSFWRTSVPHPDAPRRLQLDEGVLLDLLARLEGDERPARQAFRFVLALILLRRRQLKQVGRERLPLGRPRAQEGEHENDGNGSAHAQEVWLLLPRGAAEGEAPWRVVDPGLGPEDVAAIAEQLGEVLQGEA